MAALSFSAELLEARSLFLRQFCECVRVDLRLIQSFMGHKSINSTIRYTAVDTKRYAKLF